MSFFRKSQIPPHLLEYFEPAEIGLEPTPDAYVAEMVAVFREVRRVLRDDGVVWLNIGDSYSGKPGGPQGKGGDRASRTFTGAMQGANRGDSGIGGKNLLMIPARVALALQADGWILRSDVIWHKPNPMPESVTDRPTSSHEHVFLLTKRERYFYDAESIREQSEPSSLARLSQDVSSQNGSMRANGGGKTNGPMRAVGGETRNARNVWTIATQPSDIAHYAIMPPELAERCIKAGSKPGDTILDPFSGVGTTALVADRLGRHAVGIDLNPTNEALARDRIIQDAGLFAELA